MSIKFKYIPYIVIALLVIVILLMRGCGPSPEPQKPTIVTKIDTLWVEKPIEKKIYIPGPISYIPGDTKYIPQEIDTAAILKDYFAKVTYQDTVKIDSIGFVIIKDTISRNRIVSRETYGKYEYPTITKETTITLPPIYKNKFYIGVEANVGRPHIFNYIGADLTFVPKNDKMIYEIGAGLNTSTPGYANYKAKIGWKIGTR